MTTIRRRLTILPGERMTSWYFVGGFNQAVCLVREPFVVRVGGGISESLVLQKPASVGVGKQKDEHAWPEVLPPGAPLVGALLKDSCIDRGT